MAGCFAAPNDVTHFSVAQIALKTSHLEGVELVGERGEVFSGPLRLQPSLQRPSSVPRIVKCYKRESVRMLV
jgi:hypothetical protein